jgi:hypothetical protein
MKLTDLEHAIQEIKEHFGEHMAQADIFFDDTFGGELVIVVTEDVLDRICPMPTLEIGK